MSTFFKVVIEVPHPARVHLFRNLYHKLLENGDDVIVLVTFNVDGEDGEDDGEDEDNWD